MKYNLFLFTFQIFTRILRSLNLPVGTSQMIVPRYVTNAYDISHVVLWVSSLLVSSMWCCLFCFLWTIESKESVEIFLTESCYVTFREDPANKLKHSSVAFSTVLLPFSTHQTMVAGWWVTYYFKMELKSPRNMDYYNQKGAFFSPGLI